MKSFLLFLDSLGKKGSIDSCFSLGLFCVGFLDILQVSLSLKSQWSNKTLDLWCLEVIKIIPRIR